MAEHQRAFDGKRSAQIALEFMIVYSVIILIFIIIFALIANERAATLTIQEYSNLQLLTQDIASYINYAVSAGDGYHAVINLPGIVVTPNLYQLYIASDGIVKTQVKVGSQTISAVAYSVAKGLIINGTLVQSGGGIQVYSVSTYTGVVSLTNSRGTIYVDVQPASILALPGTMSVKQLANAKTANFNGQNSYINAGNGVSLSPGSGSYSVTAWFKTSLGLTGENSIINHGNTNDQQFIDTRDGAIRAVMSDIGNNYVQIITPTANEFNDGNWHQVTMVYDVSTHTLKLFVDGIPRGTNTNIGVGSMNPTSNFQIGMMNNARYFSGFISNIQIYNTALDASAIQSLYVGGIGGAPQVLQNLVGWWPLNGNANDYSGKGNQGTPYNINYGNVAEISLHVANNNGANSISAPIGLIASKGALLPNQNVLVLYSNATGNQTFFLQSNTSAGPSLLNTYIFNGNLTTAGNLVGWWPLTLGYGTTAYDLSGSYNNGNLINVAWQPLTYQTNFQTASFNNVNSIISSPTQSATSNGFSVNAITITAWINNTGTGRYLQNIAEVSGAPSAPATLGLGVAGAGGNLKLLWSNQANTIQNSVSGGAIPANTQMFVAGVWNGISNMLSIYINGALTANAFGNGTIGTIVSAFNIGGTYNSMYGFNGLISNVQLYKSALTQQQIGSLYSQGPPGAPIAGSSMVGWWPLDGSANDYGIPAYLTTSNNVIFKNTQYAILNGSVKITGFNGANSYINTGSNPITGSSPFTLAAWLNTKQLSTYSGAVAIGTSATGQAAYIGTVSTAQVGTSNSIGGGFYGYNIGTGVTTLNSWVNVAMTFSGGTNGAVRIYINGVDTTDSTYTPNLGSAYKTIGNIGTSYWFNGMIADVQIYNTALSPQQVQQLYEQGMRLNQNMNVSFGGG